ncbi:FapA family protein [Marinospirillum alkaliphilum]|uniref:Flagellar Assembly Protein A N-terminal region domain-containing protein n=1 Tax=Marinospirillum alkaliphilum DSM 21637 TaxID=1122209 RepID=A0A1K1TCH2_9GAMM|nr:FapA family protein [Marinospirillum alkaliphilum]SFW98335.1 hypothetical protein SAMN02745752_00066 [Marinospirillum alkaliphilum DSM 21637]
MEPLSEELMLSIPTPEELGLTFRVDEENGDFYVTYAPSGLALPVDPEHFPHIVELAGFSAAEHPIEASALATLLEAMRRGQPTDLRLGGSVDARVEVFASPNQMLAGVVVYPPLGKGLDLTREALDFSLKQSKIVRGILDESLKDLTDPATCKHLRETGKPICMVVAYGEPAYDGEDAWLETLLDEITDRRPQINEEGHVDFLELGDFPHVDADQVLVRRHPPTQGKSGWTVTGRTLKGRNGKDLVLKPKDDTVKLAPGDNDLLLSAVSGMPVVHEKGAHIEQVLKLEEVGLKSGHVRFDGSVHIKGNVNPGMKVEVTGDVKVGGLVEAAFIKAGGMIEVGGGIIGRKRSENGRNAPDEEKTGKIDDAFLEAGSIIKARFIQEAQVVAGQEVVVQKQILHSQIKAGIKIHMPGKGAIVGGVAEARELIDVAVTGAPANMPTVLRVGDTRDIKADIAMVNNQLKQLDVQKNQLMDVVAKIKKLRKPITEEKKQQIIKARDSLQQKEVRLNEELARLNAELNQLKSSRIQVRKTCYPGTQIEIDEASFSPRNDLGKVTFFLRDNDIHMR